jgi:hypothetical protein
MREVSSYAKQRRKELKSGPSRSGKRDSDPCRGSQLRTVRGIDFFPFLSDPQLADPGGGSDGQTDEHWPQNEN